MKNRWLHIYALLIALALVYLILSGAAVANAISANSVGAGQGPAPVKGHRLLSGGVGALVIVLTGWLAIAEKRIWLRRLGWILLAGTVAEVGMGEAAGMASPLISMAHAFLAPLLLSGVAAVALGTSQSWRHDPILLSDQGWPSLRGVARNTLLLVVIQVALGAAFRYGFIGVMTHILGALVVAVFLLILVVLVTLMPEHPTLRPAAITLGVIAFVQIFLGLTVVSMGSAKASKIAAVVLTQAHVAIGAVTLAATVVVMLEVWRNVGPSRAPAEAASASPDQGLGS